jgi:hypothetical protein
MQEQLITFETAKLAKEKGFTELCDARWYKEPCAKWKDSKKGAVQCNNSDKSSISRPTQSLLQKWLREVYGIHVWLIPAEVDKTYRAYVGHGIKLDLLECSYTQSFFTYEDALEEGLQEALKLIEIVKNK